MSDAFDPKFNQHHEPELMEELSNESSLVDLLQVAKAAGHGYAEVNPELNAGWVGVHVDPRNARPGYDVNFIRTFSPETVEAMLYRISQLQRRVEELEA